EVKILAVTVKSGRGRIAQTIGHLMGRFARGVVNEDRAERTVELARVGNPATVARPDRRSDGAGVVRIRVDKDGLAAVELEIPKIETLVAEGDFLAVGRPSRKVVKRGCGA